MFLSTGIHKLILGEHKLYEKKKVTVLNVFIFNYIINW